MSHKKFGPDRFSRFDVYWIQTDRQTDKQTDKPNLYIEEEEVQMHFKLVYFHCSKKSCKLPPDPWIISLVYSLQSNKTPSDPTQS